MSNLHQSTKISDTRAKLDVIRDEVQALLDLRAQLMATTSAELTAHGIEAHIVDQSGYTWKPDVGDRVAVFDSYRLYARDLPSETMMDRPNRAATVGPWAGSTAFLVEYGTFEVLMRDGDDYLVAKVPDVDDLERGHLLAVSRLRKLARSAGLHVRVRYRSIALLDAVDTVVHEGDVVTSHMYLLGIPTTRATDGEAASIADGVQA